MPRHHRRQRGYVLLLTLVVLMLAATVMAAMARRSFSRALSAERAAQELQRRWGVLSCQQVVLPDAERVLRSTERLSGRPVSSVRHTVTLGQQAFELVLSDEQAKLNVNALLRQRGRTEAERIVREVLRGGGGGGSAGGETVRLSIDSGRRASVESEVDDPDDRPLHTLSEVFPSASPGALIGATAGPSLTADVTCWSTGELNFRRASVAALRQFCSPAVDALELRKLLDAREKSPNLRASDALDRLQLTDDARDSLELRLVDESQCHSLWIVARTRQRAWYHLFVTDRSVSESQPQTISFVW